VQFDACHDCAFDLINTLWKLFTRHVEKPISSLKRFATIPEVQGFGWHNAISLVFFQAYSARFYIFWTSLSTKKTDFIKKSVFFFTREYA
jgi:hypothetical protein